MILDIRTLIITNFLYTFLIAFVYAISYNSFSGQVRASIKTLSNAMFLLSVGWMFLGLRDIIPDLHSVLWGNLASILGLVELYHTIRVFDGKNTRRRYLYPLALAFIAVNTYFYAGNNLPSVRIAVISISTATFSTLITIAMFYKPIYTSKIRFWSGIVFMLFTVLSLVRAVDSSLINFGKYTLLSNTYIQTYYFIIIFLVIFMMTFAFTLMCTHRFYDELKKTSIIDPITNIYNRNGIKQLLQQKIEESVKNNDPLCVAVFDIDEFRKFNDLYGLESGDVALQRLANNLVSHISFEDVAGRLGGDEFLLILPQTDLAQGTKIADEIKSKLESKPIVASRPESILKISYGVALLDQNLPDSNELIKSAHHELFKVRTLSENAYGT